MTFAVVDPKRYSVRTYLLDLFDYCFPLHFRSLVREQFDRCEQGKRSVREYVCELRTLSTYLPDVNEVHLRLRFWDGVHRYIRLQWARAGFDAERSTLRDLETSTERFELAEDLRVREERKDVNRYRWQPAPGQSERLRRRVSYDYHITDNLEREEGCDSRQEGTVGSVGWVG